MSRRQTLRPAKRRLPRVWLMTDPRFGDDLLPAIKRMRSQSGVIFRHYDLATEERRALFLRVLRICRQRGHMLLLAGSPRLARMWHADGFHTRDHLMPSKKLIHSAPVHNRSELLKARIMGADIVLISPVFATASHLGTAPLGRMFFMALAKQARSIKVIALGGMTGRKATTLDKRFAYGWAAIDAFRR